MLARSNDSDQQKTALINIRLHPCVRIRYFAKNIIASSPMHCICLVNCQLTNFDFIYSLMMLSVATYNLRTTISSGICCVSLILMY